MKLYLVAGHKGQPEKVKQANRPPRRRRCEVREAGASLATEKPPIFGMIQRSGEVVIRLLENVQQKTIKPLILQTVAAGTQVYTDEYNIYNRLEEWGFQHKTVNHSAHEYARDEDGDGFCEVHSNSIEGFWSLLRPWLRPHRGISQDKLPLYLSFFEFVHHVKKRGKRLLSSLLETLLKKTLESI
jgi:transposase-like protein